MRTLQTNQDTGPGKVAGQTGRKKKELYFGLQFLIRINQNINLTFTVSRVLPLGLTDGQADTVSTSNVCEKSKHVLKHSSGKIAHVSKFGKNC